ncbi:MAG: hypothetical protein AB3N14_14825 [Flavobacteriaceae bacterium]
MTINKIYLSEEIENDQVDYAHLKTDVIVHLDDGSKYRANFISITRLINEMQEYHQIAESFAKKYFWSNSMVIVNEIEKKDLYPMINYMIEEGDFQMIFEKLTH